MTLDSRCIYILWAKELGRGRDEQGYLWVNICDCNRTKCTPLDELARKPSRFSGLNRNGIGTPIAKFEVGYPLNGPLLSLSYAPVGSDGQVS